MMPEEEIRVSAFADKVREVSSKNIPLGQRGRYDETPKLMKESEYLGTPLLATKDMRNSNNIFTSSHGMATGGSEATPCQFIYENSCDSNMIEEMKNHLEEEKSVSAGSDDDSPQST